MSTERSHKSKASSLYGGTESAYITVVVDVGPFGCVGCVARVPSVWPVFHSSLLSKSTSLVLYSCIANSSAKLHIMLSVYKLDTKTVRSGVVNEDKLLGPYSQRT